MPGVSAAGELVEGGADVALERRRRQALDERAREIQRRHLREREPGVVEAAEGALLERPVLLAVVNFVEEREAGRLEGLEVASDRARRDAGPLGEVVNRRPARRLEVPEDRPLPDDFGVTHSCSAETPAYKLGGCRAGSSAFAKASADRRSFSGGWSDPAEATAAGAMPSARSCSRARSTLCRAHAVDPVRRSHQGVGHRRDRCELERPDRRDQHREQAHARRSPGDARCSPSHRRSPDRRAAAPRASHRHGGRAARTARKSR